MRLSVLCCFLLFSCALSKTVTKALTESLGQEIIEIGAPLKDLQPDLEEEPSGKEEDDTTKAAPATKRDVKKAPGSMIDGRRKIKDIDRIDGVEQEDDEQRVEKEIADIYKDTDYKADSNEQRASGESALRQGQKTDFVFAPKNINDPKQVERFRTSPDYIDCKKKKLADNLAIEQQKNSVEDVASPLSAVYSSVAPQYQQMAAQSYKFQPDLNNPREVELFRTSRDDLACDKKWKLSHDTRTTPSTLKATSTYVSMVLFTACTVGVFYF